MQRMNCFNSSIENIVKSHIGVAHAKDARTLKYIITNNDNMKYLGIKKENDIIGKGVFDLTKIMGRLWREDDVKNMHESDMQVIRSKKPLFMEQNLFLNCNGLVVVHSIRKIPIFYYGDKVRLVLTLISDSTDRETLESIKSIYYKLYDSNEAATAKFLQHFKFSADVAGEITPRELDCILSFIKRNSLKEVAKDLGITRRTVEEHLKHVKEKLKCYTSSQLMHILAKKFYGDD